MDHVCRVVRVRHDEQQRLDQPEEQHQQGLQLPTQQVPRAWVVGLDRGAEDVPLPVTRLMEKMKPGIRHRPDAKKSPKEWL